MADGVFKHLTTGGPRDDHRTTASFCQDWGRSTFRGQHTTFFYDCIEPGEEHGHSDATSLGHTGPWAVIDNGNEDFNASACVSSTGLPEDYPVSGTEPFPSFHPPTKFPDTVSRNIVPSHSAIQDEGNGNRIEKNNSRNLISSIAQNCETCRNDLQGLNYEEKCQNFRFIKGDSIENESLHSIPRVVSCGKIRFDHLTLDNSALETGTNKEGAFILARNEFNEDVKENFGSPNALSAMFELQPLATAYGSSEKLDSSEEFRIRNADDEEAGDVLVRCCGRIRQGEESPSVGFTEGRTAMEGRAAKFYGGCVKDRETQWRDVEVVEGAKVMEAGERMDAKEEKSLNFNSNADDHSLESSGEYVGNKLSDPRLARKLSKLRKVREELLFYVNIMLAWNLIQMVVLFGTLFYAFVCICHFRQAFGCNEMCLLRPRQLSGMEDVKKRWWG